MLSIRFSTTTGLVLLLLALAGCNDSSSGSNDNDLSYSGNTDAATLDDSNAEDLARATISGADRAISTETAQDTMPFSAPATTGITQDYEEWILDQSGLLPETPENGTDSESIQARSSDPVCQAGGSVDFDTTQGPGGGDPTGDMQISYNNCQINTPEGIAIIDGTVNFSWTETDWTYDYNVTFNYRGETYHLTTTFSCSDIDTPQVSCSLYDTYSDAGTTYQLTDTFVVESNNAYDVDARVYHEEHGYVTFESTELTLCSDGGFEHGTVEVTDSTDDVVLTLIFNQDCATAEATYADGTTETITY
ncbi:hypothetical protein E4656_06380 [Natronospirillum operosum]|uniref:Lipoprotein n=1 Tax=Natronospirillum operosum TaxID=2759953 RepID=A0A4Z0WBF1_9GAMM|nr:hypothetical protein [Natronospirillum operosum]TGG96019.1 hypothetical protein E4656_06380 [Natronospirillum operosum]